MQEVNFPCLYRIGQNDKVLVWSIKVVGNQITVSAGQKDGKMTVTPSFAYAKNVGRANETTPHDQAVKEAKAKWEAQKKKQYRESIEEALDTPVLPMLALDYLKHGHRAEFPAYAQRKLNGMRGKRDVKKGLFRSRSYNKVRPLAHIETQLQWLAIHCPYWHKEIDGEFYIHGMPLSDIISLVKREQEDTKLLEFHVFDLAMPIAQRVRLYYLSVIEEWMNLNKTDVEEYAPNIKIVESKLVDDEAEMLALQQEYESEGYEGIMLRKQTGMYVSGPAKTPAIFKRKSFQDEEFKILDITEGAEGRAILHFSTAEGRPFSAEMVGSDEVCRSIVAKRESILAEGKKATVKFQELSKYGVPTIGVKALVIRDYE